MFLSRGGVGEWGEEPGSRNSGLSLSEAGKERTERGIPEVKLGPGINRERICNIHRISFCKKH